jgi:pimeloyl-ACP methyl ester carboxylesterase
MTDPQKRQTIIALHGAGMQAGIWGGMMPHLLDYHVSPVSLPGHDPKKDDQPLATIQDMAQWVRDHIAGLPQNLPYVLMGHSMGALVALEAAKDAAVQSVILMGAAAAMPVNADLLALAADKPEEAGAMIRKWGIYKGHPQAEAVATVVKAIMVSTRQEALAIDLKACNDYTAGAATATALQKPALVISGEADKMTRALDGQYLADVLPQGQHVLLPDCGHMMMMEHPIESALEIKRFLSQSPQVLKSDRC